MPNLGNLVKQAEQMQRRMAETQAQLSARTVDASSGGGAVKVVATCDGTLVSINIDPQAINPSEAQLLEEMVLAAANSALAKGREVSQSELAKVTAGLKLPGLF